MNDANVALLVIGHGSRDPAGIGEFHRLVQILRERRGRKRTGMAFLEFARPNISDGVDSLMESGARHIVCQPGMLFAAGHVKSDIPRALEEAFQRWPGRGFTVAPALEMHKNLVDLCRIRFDESVSGRSHSPLDQTELLVVSRGSGDLEATGKFEHTVDVLGQTCGVARASACYSGIAKPLVHEALQAAIDSGARRIVVQPYFLFAGVLVNQVHQLVAEASRHTDKELIATEHLGPSALLAGVFESCSAAALADRG